MSTRFFTTMAMVLTVLVGAASAQAAHAYRSKATGDWSDYHTWQISPIPGGPLSWADMKSTDPLPDSGDYATIRSGHYVTDSYIQAIATLTVASGGGLTLNNGILSVATLDVQGSFVVLNAGILNFSGASPTATFASGGYLILYTNGNSLAITSDTAAPAITATGFSVLLHSGGTLELAADGATFSGLYVEIVHNNTTYSEPVFKVTANTTFGGTGEIKGLADSYAQPLIRISASGSSTVTLTNEAKMSGWLKVVGFDTGTQNFVNSGLVCANAAAELRLDSTLSNISDTAGSCSSPRWQVATDSSAVLRFAKSSTSLHGDFALDVSGGTIYFSDNVTTDGLFRLGSGGTVVVSANKSFNVTGAGGIGSGNHYCSGSSCSSDAFPYGSTSLFFVYCP